MTTNQLLGPFCQSCGMPLAQPEDFGTDAIGYRVNDWCRFRYVNGAFMDPGMTMQGMIDKCVDVMVRKGLMPHDKARALMTEVVPRLKRWRVVSTSRAMAGHPA